MVLHSTGLQVFGAPTRPPLYQACGDDHQLRARVEGHLRVHEKSGDPLDLPDRVEALPNGT